MEIKGSKDERGQDEKREGKKERSRRVEILANQKKKKNRNLNIFKN